MRELGRGEHTERKVEKNERKKRGLFAAWSPFATNSPCREGLLLILLSERGMNFREQSPLCASSLPPSHLLKDKLMAAAADGEGMDGGDVAGGGAGIAGCLFHSVAAAANCSNSSSSAVVCSMRSLPKRAYCLSSPSSSLLHLLACT